MNKQAITTLPKASVAGPAWVMVAENPAVDPNTARAKAAVDADGNFIIVVPTTDPGIAGALWRTGSTLKVSTG